MFLPVLYSILDSANPSFLRRQEKCSQPLFPFQSIDKKRLTVTAMFLSFLLSGAREYTVQKEKKADRETDRYV